MSGKFKQGNENPQTCADRVKSREKFARCQNCTTGDSKMYGPPLSRRTIYLTEPGQPWTAVAWVDECLHCNWISVLGGLSDASMSKGITMTALERLCRVHRRRDFTLEEFQNAAHFAPTRSKSDKNEGVPALF